MYHLCAFGEQLAFQGAWHPCTDADEVSADGCAGQKSVQGDTVFGWRGWQGEDFFTAGEVRLKLVIDIFPDVGDEEGRA
jgi:hypothetical protein